MSAAQSVGDIQKAGETLALEMLRYRKFLHPGSKPVDTNRFHNAELRQRTLGDFVCTWHDGRHVCLEVKTEARHTGNVFLEEWSNQTRRPKFRKRGWLYTSQADFYVCVFLDISVAYVMRMDDLQRWALKDENTFDYGSVVVNRSLNNEQRNRTRGWLVPWAALTAPRISKKNRRSSEPVKLRAYHRTQAGGWVEVCTADPRGDIKRLAR